MALLLAVVVTLGRYRDLLYLLMSKFLGNRCMALCSIRGDLMSRPHLFLIIVPKSLFFHDHEIIVEAEWVWQFCLERYGRFERAHCLEQLLIVDIIQLWGEGLFRELLQILWRKRLSRERLAKVMLARNRASLGRTAWCRLI